MNTIRLLIVLMFCYLSGISQHSPILSYSEDTPLEILLAGKYLYNGEIGGGLAKKNHLWLCEDGTFQARFIRRGLLKGLSGPYQGRHKGRYVIIGTASEGSIVLEFDHLPSVHLDIVMQGNGLTVNNQPFLMGEHDQCR